MNINKSLQQRESCNSTVRKTLQISLQKYGTGSSSEYK
ncbi:hypothetical protein BOH78_1316 [Pichia kudriavzevii]|uniref:Uncharacterized protein n=1 Tax=Pichia kudriavzevii TaxID=4909 RepID=A0A1V2LR87_PICKU|nr:hypothetical protein BOH78_1316 [Pichia kudriavzevii]